MNNVEVSIIIPVYNVEKYLEKCLNSVINQTFKNIEIIIVNDGSTDKSLDIIKKFMHQDKRIVLINKKNEGPSAARNSGLKIARGKWIQYIDSDDWIEINYIEKVYEFADKNSLDIVSTKYYINYESGKEEIKKMYHKKEINSSSEYLKEFFENFESPSLWNRFIKKEIYTKNNLFSNEKISLGEDLYITPKLFYFSKKIGFLNKEFYHYRQNSESITHTKKSLKMIQVFNVFTDLDNFFSKYDSKYLDFLYVYSKDHILGFLLMKPYFFENNYREACKKFIKWVNDSRFEKNKEKFSKKARYIAKIVKLFPNWRIVFIISFILNILTRFDTNEK